MTLSLSQIDDSVDALLENAEDLIDEALLLLDAKRSARAFALAHLSREELSKSVMLLATGHRLLAGAKVDWKRLMARLRDHKAKLKLETIHQAMFMNSMGQTETSETLMSIASGAAAYRNDQKNAALYVGFDGGSISRPSRSFDQHQARRTVMLARLWLRELQFVRAKGGRFVDMPPDRFKGRNFDEFTAEQKMETLKELGPLYRSLLDEVFKDEKPASES